MLRPKLLPEYWEKGYLDQKKVFRHKNGEAGVPLNVALVHARASTLTLKDKKPTKGSLEKAAWSNPFRNVSKLLTTYYLYCRDLVDFLLFQLLIQV